MPKRTDIKKILLIGSGPIVIGQACEFDYSGTQACKALREEGYEVVLVNSNPATIMTDPGTADRTYIEPITPEYVAEVIRRERPDALLPTLGGQTGLNTALAVEKMGVLDEYGVEMIGARRDVIKKAEDRELFREAMAKIGLDVAKSRIVKSMDEAREALEELGLPIICRASYTLGGAGGGIAYNKEEFERVVASGLKLSPVNEVMLDESILGWKEYEMEVMRDRNDNCVIVCSIENFDPMGVHTGDSITVAPAQTLSDKEYQRMRDATLAVMREIGVETGGSNVQFAIDPDTGRMVVIEMNPRVSRSSALASKATGFPIAKIAAKLAVGYTLDELPNDITRETKACFEPSIDYVVTKVPRWTFEKFPEADPTLTIQMKSVGETMAIGRTFKESLQKALRGTETGHFGLGGGKKDLWDTPDRPREDAIVAGLATPNEHRMSFLRYAFKSGMTLERVHDLTAIDPWFLDQLQQLVEIEDEIRAVGSLSAVTAAQMRRFKRAGFGDQQLSYWLNAGEAAVRAKRKELDVEAVFKQVDTCAAEFEAVTPYYYSTYETEDESPGPRRPVNPEGLSPYSRVMILGGGPNRIGQGIEFDYCCCQASYALEELGVESVMVNSNPETVSTDYDTSDLLFFEPLTTEDVLNVVDRLKPDGVIVQFGGQTPLNLAKGLEAAGVPIIGTSPEMIDVAEDRDRFAEILKKTGLRQPPNGTATDAAGARKIAERVGYPVLVRPSYVLGGRAMEICYDGPALSGYMQSAVDASPDRPVLIDRFLEDAIEVDVDCVADFGVEGGGVAIVAGVMEHIEEAGVHSGDSACCLPPHSLPKAVVEEIEAATIKLAQALNVCGLMNVQFAVKKEGDDFTVYVLEVNPRASRTAPFVSKATGMPWAKIAAKAMAGVSLAKQGVADAGPPPKHFSVKESVFPFSKFSGVDIVLGPEMRSTGEVMGIAHAFPTAYAKSQIGAGNPLPPAGAGTEGGGGRAIFISMAEGKKAAIVEPARRLAALGYEILATSGTGSVLKEAGVEAEIVRKVQEGRPNLIDHMANGRVGFIFNTPSGKGARTDEGKIRAASVAYGVPCVTTLPGCVAVVDALEAQAADPTPRVVSLQEWHAAEGDA
ncbi:carbamoyl-phosphate synthase large subunit [Alienimonas californiensis]|uniref:Carbamoyl phosphate synthase large chain n=1 Tax=Alienimonas californiensis TaxID=2527989 RepID=A0A517PAM8_9PLAN|nr:carbamoyl-phosphate synthase large subunit [Alienimonas californiensis]QDT16429.1 Carbamoyl-phosphate synthase large chain [Alienimonas californiensis]